MAKTSVKFQNDWPKTVGGVALTRHPLSIVDERTGHSTPISHLRANAGATKRLQGTLYQLILHYAGFPQANSESHEHVAHMHRLILTFNV